MVTKLIGKGLFLVLFAVSICSPLQAVSAESFLIGSGCQPAQFNYYLNFFDFQSDGTTYQLGNAQSGAIVDSGEVVSGTNITLTEPSACPQGHFWLREFQSSASNFNFLLLTCLADPAIDPLAYANGQIVSLIPSEVCFN